MQILNLLIESFKVIHCSIIKVLCCLNNFLSISHSLIRVKNFFIFYSNTSSLYKKFEFVFLSLFFDSSLMISNCVSFVNNFLHLFFAVFYSIYMAKGITFQFRFHPIFSSFSALVAVSLYILAPHNLNVNTKCRKM